jgi:hypothetical protein
MGLPSSAALAFQRPFPSPLKGAPGDPEKNDRSPTAEAAGWGSKPPEGGLALEIGWGTNVRMEWESWSKLCSEFFYAAPDGALDGTPMGLRPPGSRLGQV